MNIVSFSGGKDSTAMLLMMLEKGIPIDRVICVDTTKEFPQMYEHIKKVQKMIYPLKIDTMQFDYDYYFSEHIKTKGKNKGKKGYGWCDMTMRWCTGEKKSCIRKYMKNFKKEDIVNYQGIAYDERERINKNKFLPYRVEYPLVDWGITEKEALEYCYSKGFDWEGLYEKFHRVSCWCCPLSRISELRVLYNDFPELWEKLEEMDKKSFRKFRSDYSVKDLREKFANENL
jgi:3'-phosphoadenosine 5'-phosphosulfate sulfotransferase (PAPS reductase)/FAD synthetase